MLVFTRPPGIAGCEEALGRHVGSIRTHIHSPWSIPIPSSGETLRDVERMAYVPWVKSGDEPGLVQRSYRHKKETVAIGQAHLIQRPSKHRLAVSQECLRQFRGIGWHLGS